MTRLQRPRSSGYPCVIKTMTESASRGVSMAFDSGDVSDRFSALTASTLEARGQRRRPGVLVWDALRDRARVPVLACLWLRTPSCACGATRPARAGSTWGECAVAVSRTRPSSSRDNPTEADSSETLGRRTWGTGVGDHADLEAVALELRQARQAAGHRGGGERLPGPWRRVGGQLPDPGCDVVPGGPGAGGRRRR